MTEFTPFASLAGGVLIGLSAVMLMGFFGRIAGISGITSGLFTLPNGDWGWRLAFISGLVAAPLAVMVVSGAPVVQTVSANLPLMAVAGLLVGFGSVFGGGCTSGHGVCGLARLSARSLAATATFMFVAIATVFIMRHLFGG